MSMQSSTTKKQCRELFKYLNHSSEDEFHLSELGDLSFCKENYQQIEKERTNDETYEDVRNKIDLERKKQRQLRTQFNTLRKQKINECLAKFQDELKFVNQENSKLRQELAKIKHKNIDEKSQKLSAKSFKPKKSVSRIEMGPKIQAKKNKQNSPNFLLTKRQSCKLIESSSSNFGRSSMHSPLHHKRRESQLTERKNDGENNGVSCSDLEDEYSESMRQSLQGKTMVKASKNVFVELLSSILVEQKMYDEQKYLELEQEANSTAIVIGSIFNHTRFVNNLEEKIIDTKEKIDQLQLILHQYQGDITDMNLDLRCLSQLTKQMQTVKGKYIQMEHSSKFLPKFKQELTLKTQLLKQKQHDSKHHQQKISLPSVQTLLKVFSNNHYQSQSTSESALLKHYCSALKEIFKQTEIHSKKMAKNIKVKELISEIRQGRKKFNELLNIYQSRIEKLEEKIKRVKLENEKAEKN